MKYPHPEIPHKNKYRPKIRYLAVEDKSSAQEQSVRSLDIKERNKISVKQQKIGNYK